MRAARRKGGSVMSRKCIGIDIGGTTVKTTTRRLRRLGMFVASGESPHEKGKRRGTYPGGYCGGHKEKGSGKGTFDGRF